MKFKRLIVVRFVLLISLLASLSVLSTRLQADTGSCGGVTITLPFTDVMASPFFCQIAESYYSGLTNGTSATTYSPTQTVTREQMAAFTTRTMEQSLKRGSLKAVTKKWWTPIDQRGIALTNVGTNPVQVEFDGTDLWVSNYNGGSIMRLRPSGGKLLGTWTGTTKASGIVCALGKIFIIGQTSPGSLYMIDPTQPPGAVTTLSTNLGDGASGIAFDGKFIWTANAGGLTQGGSVSIVSLNPITVNTVTTGFVSPFAILYDGTNIWLTDEGDDTIKKLSQAGPFIEQTISVGDEPNIPVFDGTNIWVPNQFPNSVTVVRVKDASGNPLANCFILATLTGNELNGPWTAAFDGERILVTNLAGNTVSLWKAAGLKPLGAAPMGPNTQPIGACSDGLNFWITLFETNQLVRF